MPIILPDDPEFFGKFELPIIWIHDEHSVLVFYKDLEAGGDSTYELPHDIHAEILIELALRKDNSFQIVVRKENSVYYVRSYSRSGK